MQDSAAGRLDGLRASSMSLVNEALGSVAALHDAMKARDFSAMALMAEDAIQAIHDAVLTQAELVGLGDWVPEGEAGYLLELGKIYCIVAALADDVAKLVHPGGHRVGRPRILH